MLEPGIDALHEGAVDHLGSLWNQTSCSSEPPGLTMTSPDPLFGAEAELHLALVHLNDRLICVTVRLDMDAGPNAPPDDH